jgi:hypothetical protein
LECDVQGGDANQIQGADAALAWMFSQLPFVAGNRRPSYVVSLSWPKNMEVQDLYPLTSSTYTFPTGAKVGVPCFAQHKVADIERTECPDTFVHPMDPNHDRPCVKVLCTEVLGVCIHSIFSLTPHALHCTRSLALWQHTLTRSMDECGLEAMLSD